MMHWNRIRISRLIVSLMILGLLFPFNGVVMAGTPGGESLPASAGSALLAHTGIGPYDPPTPQDTVFNVDSASALDISHSRSGGSFQFSLPINRVVGRTTVSGYLLEPTRLSQNGIVSARGRLRLLVRDIDAGTGATEGVPETNRVYLNGYYIGTLTGTGGLWSIAQLDFDIRYLRFGIPACREYGDVNGAQHLSACYTAPTAGQNIIRIDPDTAGTGGDAWALEVDWGSLSFEAARPILFVHGKGGSANGGGYDYWDKYDGEYYFNFRGKLSAAGFLTAITENRLGAESSIAYNALQLKTIVRELRTRYGVRRINIVAHSKGGLDSRGYISDSWLNPDNDVETLFTLASPHHGSYLANVANDHPTLAGLLGNPQTDAMRDLAEPFMNNTFNPTHPARSGVRYYTVAADSGEDYWYGRDIPLWQIFSLPDWGQRAGAPVAWALLRSGGQYKGENDFLVTVGSANLSGIPGHAGSSYSLGSYSLNHHSIRAAESESGVEDLRISNLVWNALDIRAGMYNSTASLQPATASGTDAASVPQSTLSVATGSIRAGETVTRWIGIDSKKAGNISLLWGNKGDLYLELVAPDGKEINSVTVPDSMTYAEDRTGGELMPFLSGKISMYNLKEARPGLWEVRIRAAANLAGGQAEWALLTTQESPVALELTTDQPWHRLNDAVLITASVKDGKAALSDVAIQVTILDPLGAAQTVKLLDDGTAGDRLADDGIYSYQMTAAEPGIYRLSADAAGTREKLAFERTAFAEVTVGSKGAALGKDYSDTAVDANRDGLYDSLSIAVPVEVAEAGRYGIVATLYDRNHREMGYADSTAALTPGTHFLTLAFDGRLIAGKGGEGPFTLGELRLIDKGNSAPLQTDYQAEAYTTKAYGNAQFQREPLALTGTHTDKAVDLNGNGLYDALFVSVEVDVRQAGVYHWNAQLVDGANATFGWSSNLAYLKAGRQVITFRFEGTAIAQHPVDGPYYLKDLSLWGANGVLNGVDPVATAAYRFTQFERADSRSAHASTPATPGLPVTVPTID